MSKPVRRSELRQTLGVALAPRSANEGVSARTPPPTLAEPQRCLRVLVVEDNPVSTAVVTRLLEHAGHEVMQAEHGQAALGILADDADFDLVLMDLQMPTMDGFEATLRIRRSPALRHLVVVAMTAHARKGDREQCLAQGMDDYLAKPIRAASLRQTVARWSSEGPRRLLTPAPPGADPHEEAARSAGTHGAAEAADGPAFDVVTVRRALGGPGDLLAELAALLLVDVPNQLVQLKRAAVAGDASTVARGAHRLCGAVANLEAEEMMGLCRALERAAAASGAAGEMTRHVDALSSAWGRMEPLVREVCT